MTDQKPCPRCGCTVSDATTYYFIAVENLRWHQRCWDAEHPEPITKPINEPIQDQIEEKAQ